MKNNLQALREYQSRVDLSELEKSIYISIDRLTVIFDSENQSLRRIFRELRKSLDNIIQEFSIQENLREDYFTLYKTINEDSINLIFFQLSDYGGYQVIRLDFNPNSLKEFEGLQVWRQIMNYARLNRLEIRLSRLDLAFDIFNRPEIVFLQHIKGGVSHKIFYGRGGNIESKYWGASGSNVQVRLYDKNIEVLSHKRADKLNIESKPFWWRLELQLRRSRADEWVKVVHETLDSFYSPRFIPESFKATDQIMLDGLHSNHENWNKLSVNSRKKYRKLAKEVAKEDELTQHLKASFSESVEQLDKELNNWLYGMTVNRNED